MNWFAPRPFEWFLLAEVLLYMAGILWFLWGMRRHTGGASTQPLVSVVVAARNEEARIAGCLSLLAAQDYPLSLIHI